MTYNCSEKRCTCGDSKRDEKSSEGTCIFANIGNSEHITKHIAGHISKHISQDIAAHISSDIAYIQRSGHINDHINSHVNGHINSHINNHINSHISEDQGFNRSNAHISQDPFNPADTAVAAAVTGGRYNGRDRLAELELRVDNQLNIVSGDFFRVGQEHRTWVASFRSATANRVVAGTPVHIIAEDRHKRISQGELLLISVPGANVIARITLFSQLDGLPFNRQFDFVLSFYGPGYRRLGIETEIEVGVQPPPTAVLGNGFYSLESVLQNAGYDVETAGRPSSIPPAPPEGWSEKQLEAIMHILAQSDTTQPGFDLRMLWASRMNRSRVLGVMFDIRGSMQRQGFAVFDSVLRERPDIPEERRLPKIVQTAVHEAGHALNLAHRFEREVGRADSLSPMNYDWKYREGNHVEDFWRDFRFEFDRDELEFLRHGSYNSTVPGGAPFHSVRYWADGDGGYSPYVPEVPLNGWELEIIPPTNPVFLFGQPVTMGIKLTNRTGVPQSVPNFLLDQKGGFLEILIERQGEHEHAFHPLTHRCYDLDNTSTDVILAPGQSITENANLTFGSSGFPFAEPGNYRIQALLAVYVRDASDSFQRVTFSNSVRIRVSMPQTREEERLALSLFEPDTGLYFALGGSCRLEDTEKMLLDLAKQRDKSKSGSPRDPIAVHIHRAVGFNANRQPIKMVNGKIELGEADKEKAASHLTRLNDVSLNCLDKVTHIATQKYIEANFRKK